MTAKNHHNQKISPDIETPESIEEQKIDDQVHRFANLESDNLESQEAESIKSTSKIAWVVAIFGLILGLLISYQAFHGFFFSSVNVSTVVVETSTPTPSPSVLPTATPPVTKDKSSVLIHVLNGSGTPGLAGVAKTQLESLGYKNIEAGNADSFDYKKTQISVRPGMTEIGNLVLIELKDKYSVDTQMGSLPITGTYDVEIILGSE